ncbi:hypothetical protein AMTR_s00137p00069590 [Amborella trichopoda]|uniref:Uncharacterized protein n=1 Tax=Amborella trichopoda TaxID=13333 RepID=W1NET3_AMBTC|nr:hypothetical protein AMTR_s00137p00069590 [Amborella trichopoda]
MRLPDTANSAVAKIAFAKVSKGKNRLEAGATEVDPGASEVEDSQDSEAWYFGDWAFHGWSRFELDMVKGWGWGIPGTKEGTVKKWGMDETASSGYFRPCIGKMDG